MNVTATDESGDWREQDVRRVLRVLGAQSASPRDADGCARAARLVADVLERRGVPAEIIATDDGPPLLVAGGGPTLLLTYLDDPACAAGTSASPPRISGDLASGVGVVRKAGVLAACGALLAERGAESVTLVVETDRHAGSGALEQWLRVSGRRFGAALWEVVDLPTPTPALFRSANGVVRAHIELDAFARPVDALYASVLPDAGFQLAGALAALKSGDLEVLLPRFYDDIAPPSDADMLAIQGVEVSIGAWLSGAARNGAAPLSVSHQALGIFCAPALFVRELRMPDAGVYLGGVARATIEARTLPGQSSTIVVRSIIEFLRRRLPGVQVEPTLVREASQGALVAAARLDASLAVLPVGPGSSPAATLEAHGVATAGYAVVHRGAPVDVERVAVSDIIAGARTLSGLASACHSWLATRR